MENPERDTKFNIPAKLLIEELKNADDPEKLLTGRLYDLASFVIANLSSYDYDAHPWNLIDCIPDITDWNNMSVPNREVDYSALPKYFWKKFWEDPNATS